MADPRWDEVFSGRLTGDLPAVARLSTPLVRTPTCPEHCSGNHGVEATIGCGPCGLTVGRLIAHEWVSHEGHYFYTREPVAGYWPEVADCPRCKTALGRVAPR